MMPLPMPAALPQRRGGSSAFAGCDVCLTAGLRVRPDAAVPFFDWDTWDLSCLADTHRMVKDYELVWEFKVILNPAWRVVAKEVVLALMTPQHEAVLECPFALRRVQNPRTCYRRLQGLTSWFNWLTKRGVAALGEVTQEMCELYLEERSWSIPKPHEPSRRLLPETIREHVFCMKLVAWYDDLLSTDGYGPGFVPWPGKTAAQVVGRMPVRGENKVQPVPDGMLQPLLETCLYLVNTVGPHVADLLEDYRAKTAPGEIPDRANLSHAPLIRKLLDEIRASGQPLPELSEKQLAQRRALFGEDALERMAWGHMSRLIGAQRMSWELRWLLRPEVLELAAEVGFQQPWGRHAAVIPRSDDGVLVPWTVPLAEEELRIMADYVRTACLTVISALTGMRSSELHELSVGCRRTEKPLTGKDVRFRVAGRLIKFQKFGGVPDEWVVIEQVDSAVALAERLVDRPEGEALFDSIELNSRLSNLRIWLEKSGTRERWGLPVIPKGPVSARSLRRTLSLAIAQRPGGLLAAKVALKHISVATTEGYAATPGGSQRLFLAEVEEAEEETRLELTVEAFREAQAGLLPAGPGARYLIEAFHHVDAELKEAARSDPKVLADDRHLESLLRKVAKTLHVGAANFCWFRDPSKALCLKLAGTPDAKRPLVGMCDSARCPQATHHLRHRSVWLGQITTIDVFVESPRVGKGEKMRLVPERDRAVRVVAEIDAAAPAASMGED
ncbi:integrase [Streptomyces sp. A5-4]|uniref:integrase n=1 Tax=Streptomyces sp. A5-4 TaxID=3384771 RepID=UPI003DA94B41